MLIAECRAVRSTALFIYHFIYIFMHLARWVPRCGAAARRGRGGAGQAPGEQVTMKSDRCGVRRVPSLARRHARRQGRAGVHPGPGAGVAVWRVLRARARGTLKKCVPC